MGAPVLRFAARLHPGAAAANGAQELDPTQVDEVTGAWVRGAAGWYAEFDLERHLPWLLAGAVQSLWLPGGLAQPQEVRVLDGITPLEPSVRPRLLGRDWVFDVTVAAPERALDASTWVLAIFDPVARTYDERPAELDGGRLRFARVARTNTVRWSLERRIDGVTVARAHGDY
jgi:hypothetical protein